MKSLYFFNKKKEKEKRLLTLWLLWYAVIQAACSGIDKSGFSPNLHSAAEYTGNPQERLAFNSGMVMHVKFAHPCIM